MPSPSPGGDSVAFLYDITGVPQVWKASTRGGWPEQLTFFPERISSVEFSPKGDLIAFSMDAGGNERHGIYSLQPDASDFTPLETDPEVIHNWGAWSPDGSKIAYSSNERDAHFFDIYVRPLDDKPRMALQQDGMNSIVRWSDDGRYLLISRAHTNLNNDLYMLDLDRDVVRLLTAHDGEALYSSAHFAGDGSLLLLTNLDREFTSPARLDIQTGKLEFLTGDEWDVEELVAARNGQVIAWSRNEDGYSRIHLEVDSEVVEVRGLPGGVVAGLELSEDGSMLVFTHYEPISSANVWSVNTATGEATQLTFASQAGIPRSALSEPQLVRFGSFDGLEIPAFLYLPRGATLPVPVVVHVHGGPESQARPVFNPTIQYLAHNGFGVLVPNVRGSTGYGKTYTHLDDVHKRMDSVADLAAAVRWLQESETAIPGKIAVMGGSYGGFMTLAALTAYPDLWAAGVDTVGIANFVTFLENTGPWRRKLREAEYGSLENDREFLDSISPINHVDRLRAPLMVIHGANDPRVPVREAEQIVEGVRSRGGVVEYLRYDDEGHGLVKLPNRISSSEAIASFLDEHLLGIR